MALGAILLLALALRLKGLHDPILDHPGWRQGDTAAIARNFATLDFNPFHAQTDYDGPPPNYVELELQIVPWLAALLYKVFGIHEVFGRVISIAFSLATIAVVASFARFMFASAAAGLVAAAALAIYPGSVYYGRTFMPDTAMTFFLTAGIFASTRWIADGARFGGRFALAATLTALALLAKPVAIVGLVPIACALVAKKGFAGTLRSPQTYAFFAVTLLPYAGYDAYVRSIAEWHWASGITQLHVLPSLRTSLTSLAALRAKLGLFRNALGMLATTMLGKVDALVAVCGVVAAVALAPRSGLTRPLLFGWLAAALAYAYVVVTVERVDYYLYVFLPLGALFAGSLADTLLRMRATPRVRGLLLATLAFAFAGAFFTDRRPVAAYYRYSKTVYRNARALDATLGARSLVVMGHYDPSVLYYIHRKGWQEDPYLWTPFDEQSAIRKGARYFIAIEPRRLARNVELAAWLQRFPITNPAAAWPIYETDYAKVLPGAEERWQAFRRNERAHALPGDALRQRQK